MMLGKLPFATAPPHQSSSRKSASGKSSSPVHDAGPPLRAALSYTNQKAEIAFQFTSEKFNNRRELLPPFSAVSPGRRPRPRSFDSDDYSYPKSNGLISRVMEAAESMATLP